MDQYDELKARAERKLLASIVYCALKPIFDGTKLEARIDGLKEVDGLAFVFTKDTHSFGHPNLIVETTLFYESGKTETLAWDCFGMDCGLDVVTDAITSMISVRLNHIKEGESDDDRY